MTERVSAIVDAIRLRVEDELRQHIEALDAEYQQRFDEQRRDSEEQRRTADEERRAAQVATAELQQQWAGRVAEAEARGAEAVASAIEKTRAEFESSGAVAREQTARRFSELQAFQHDLDRCTTLTDVLNHVAGQLGPDEALAVHREGRWHHWKPVGVTAAAPDGWESVVGLAAAVGTAVCQDHLTGVPILIEGRVVAALISRQAPEHPDDDGRERMAHAVAARLTAVTASRLSQAMRWAQGPTVPADLGSFPYEARETDAVAAQRYARLLVSEIKLYNEATVREGRARRDLAQRLEDEITRARQTYEVRVTADVPGRAAHFHAALVEILADGDATRLG